METIAALGMGLGLAAACGLRVFVPLLIVGVATKLGLMSPGQGFEWVASWPALLALTTASLLEVCAYYVPWLDHALDTVATPAAAIAGALMTASQLGIAAPGGTPRPIVERLNTEVGRMLADPAVRERLISLGYQPRGGSIPEMERTIQADRTRWRAVIQANNIRGE